MTKLDYEPNRPRKPREPWLSPRVISLLILLVCLFGWACFVMWKMKH